MNTLVWIILATMLNGLVAIVGAFTLLINKKTLDKIVFALVAFSAGALISGAFLHMINESIEKILPFYAFVLVIVGFSIFYLMERLLHWHHCHKHGTCEVHSFTYLILFGDGIHNFIDGLVIAASFLINIQFGMITTLLIISHEIPQELGDFGALIFGGFSRKKALIFNYISQLTCVIGGIIGFFISPLVGFSDYILPFAAGGFIYIAASDLIPALHTEKDIKKSLLAFLVFILGVLLMAGFKVLLA